MFVAMVISSLPIVGFVSVTVMSLSVVNLCKDLLLFTSCICLVHLGLCVWWIRPCKYVHWTRACMIGLWAAMSVLQLVWPADESITSCCHIPRTRSFTCLFPFIFHWHTHSYISIISQVVTLYNIYNDYDKAERIFIRLSVNLITTK